MIIFLYGKDTFRSRAHLGRIIDKFRQDRDPQGYNVTRLDALSKGDADRLINEVQSVPFLATRRLVVIESLLASKDKSKQTDFCERIDKKTLPEATVIVFWESGDAWKTKEANSLFTRLAKEKYAQQFDELKGAKLMSWIGSEIKERGGDIQPEALQFLAAQAGVDTWRISNLIDQLLAYANRQIITMEDARLWLTEKADDNIFTLVDAVIARQPKKVYAQIRAQYDKGEDAQFIFAMIVRQWRILLQLRDLFERDDNISSDALAKKLSLHPFVVRKSLPLMKRYDGHFLKRVYRDLLEFDIQVKTGQATPEWLLGILVGKLMV